MPAMYQEHILRNNSINICSAAITAALTRSLVIAFEVDPLLENANVCAKAAIDQCFQPSNPSSVSAVLGSG